MEHPLVSIALKRPGAPKDVHSPPSMPLPAAKVEVNGAAKDKEQKEQEAPKPRPVRKREPVRRVRKEEVEAYGRSFAGCGLQDDYEVTTKLGEGTFGWVPFSRCQWRVLDYPLSSIERSTRQFTRRLAGLSP
jgi:serine/threonine-protein kinase BUR1